MIVHEKVEKSGQNAPGTTLHNGPGYFQLQFGMKLFPV